MTRGCMQRCLPAYNLQHSIEVIGRQVTQLSHSMPCTECKGVFDKLDGRWYWTTKEQPRYSAWEKYCDGCIAIRLGGHFVGY